MPTLAQLKTHVMLFPKHYIQPLASTDSTNHRWKIDLDLVPFGGQESTVSDLRLVKSADAKPTGRKDPANLLKPPRVSEPTPFKSLLFKGRLYAHPKNLK